MRIRILTIPELSREFVVLPIAEQTMIGLNPVNICNIICKKLTFVI